MVKHGESKTKLNKVWRNMKDRCFNPNNKRYPHYGGRGITVCDEWLDYIPFRDWAMQSGYMEGLSIDRINNDGDYSQENCRWADAKTQNNNFSRNKLITVNGETKSLSALAKEYKIHRNTLEFRLKQGWGIREALLTRPTVANRSPIKKAENYQNTVRDEGWRANHE